MDARARACLVCAATLAGLVVGDHTASLVAPVAAETLGGVQYAPPAGWTAQSTSDRRAFTRVDKQAGTFCRIALYGAAPSLGAERADFDRDWRELIAPAAPGAAAPTVAAPQTAGAWRLTMGVGAFTWEKRPAMAVLATLTGGAQRVSVVYLATGDCTAQFQAFLGALDLGKPAPAAPAPASPAPAPAAAPHPAGAPAPSALSASVVDGWAMTARPDFVEGQRDGVVVRIHWVSAIPDDLRGSSDAVRDHFWQTLVAPRYAQIADVVRPRIEAYIGNPAMQATAVERATGRQVYLGFHATASGGRLYAIEIMAPSRAALAQFLDAPQADALGALNRFPVAAAALVGTWGDSNSATKEYYNVSDGSSAGLRVAASSYLVTFARGGRFTSDIKAVSGMTGSLRFAQERQAGTWAAADGWTVTTTAKGTTRAFNAWFEYVRGGRVLHLVDARYPSMHDVLVPRR